MEFQHPMFTRNGVRNLKEIKRGNQPKKNDQEEEMGVANEEPADTGARPSEHVAKKARHDYSTFKTDVARLQKNLDAFEADLKEHSMQVQLKLACAPRPPPTLARLACYRTTSIRAPSALPLPPVHAPSSIPHQSTLRAAHRACPP
jgi:hypothetical protein